MTTQINNENKYTMKKLITVTIALLSITNFSAQTADLFFEQTNEFLKRNVSPEGKLDYAYLKKSPGELMYILDNVSKIKPVLKDKDAIKAFWINAYNLCVVKGVIDNYPLNSVNDVKGFFKENMFLIAGQELTLDDIENTILREGFVDAGIHFVLTSAANGGAKLLNEAFLPEKVNDQIKQQTIKAINDKNFIMINKDTKIISLSKIFDWYKPDFVTGYFNQIDFVNIFLDKKLDPKYKILFYEFDWSLNKK